MRILVVDQSRAMRMIVKRTLRQAGFWGHTMDDAADGAEALQAIRNSPPDLVLADWNMPDMSGFELLEQLRGDGLHVKLGFVTPEGTLEMRKMARSAGACFFISRPFTADKFRKNLEPHIY